MARKTGQSESTESDPLEASPDEIRFARGSMHTQIRNGLGMWAAGLEFWNVMVREWTGSRRKALEHAIRELGRADEEADPDKRAHILANVFAEETQNALKDVLAASIRAADVGMTHSMRAMKQAAQQASERSRPGSGAASDRT
jgi:hypothetical protein